MAWFSSATGHLGVIARGVNADGSPAGAPVTMPGTGAMNIGMGGRTPLVARAGGGLYVAYPMANGVRLWRVGATGARTVAGTGDSPAVAVAAAGDGRIWVAWTRGFGDPDVLARRSNTSASRFGATVDAGHPKDALQAYKLDASDAGGPLDLLGNFNIDTSTTAVTSYRRILPGLTLKAKPRKIPRGKKTRVRLTVTDAGDPVQGATVRAGGESGTTDRRGRVTLKPSSRSAIVAKASKSGYTGARKRIKTRGR
jgi:hypothetical protein